MAPVRGWTGGGRGVPGGRPTASRNLRWRSASDSVGRAGVEGGGKLPDSRRALDKALAIAMIRMMIGNMRWDTGWDPPTGYFTSSCERSGPAMVSRILVSASTLRIFM